MRIPDRVRNMGVATIGQGLNFVAMLFPVIGKEAGQLAYLMFPLSLAAVLFKLGSLSFHVRYLTLKKEQRRLGTAVSLAGLLIFSILTSLLGLICCAWNSYWGQLLMWAGLLTLSHGLYYMAVAVLITEEREALYGKVRFGYGVLNAVLTAAVVWLIPFQAGLIVVAFLITFATGAWMMVKCDNSLVGPFLRELRNILGLGGRRYIRESWRTTSAVLVSDIGFQIQGFLTPLMGVYQEMWAIVVRLSGGFGTLGQQIVAPVFEIKMAAGMRDREFATAESWARKAQLVGLALALVVVPVQIGAVMFAGSGEVDNIWQPLALISIYTLGLLASSVSMKSPYILGHERGMLWWSILRVILILPMVFLHQLTLLAFMSVAQLLLGALLVPMSVRRSARLEPKLRG